MYKKQRNIKTHIMKNFTTPTESATRIEEFFNIITNNKIKFTKPQQAIVDRILKGDVLTVINKHYANGGEFMWLRQYSSYPEYAGSVYKAFFNIAWQIEKKTGERYEIGKNFIQDTYLTK